MTDPMTPTTLAADAAQALQWIIEKDDAGDMLYRRAGPFAERAEIAAAALTAMSEQNTALSEQVAELTRERDEALAWRDVLAGFNDAAEAKLARLEGERNMAVSALEFEAKRSRRHLAASTLAILAALTEGTPDE